MPRLIRCRSKIRHNTKFSPEEDIGGMLIVFDGNSIYAKCKGSNNHNCKRWTKIDVDFPGIKIDFEKAALKQTAMPKKFRFEMAGKDIQHAPIVIED